MLCSGLIGYRMQFTTGICGVEHIRFENRMVLEWSPWQTIQGRCLVLHRFYCIGPSVTLMVKWPVSALRISVFKKLLYRMCLYIGVIIEGLLERNLYPSNSSYEVRSACTLVGISFSSLNNNGVVHPLILTNASLHTYDLMCYHVPVWTRSMCIG